MSLCTNYDAILWVGFKKKAFLDILATSILLHFTYYNITLQQLLDICMFKFFFNHNYKMF